MTLPAEPKYRIVEAKSMATGRVSWFVYATGVLDPIGMCKSKASALKFVARLSKGA